MVKLAGRNNLCSQLGDRGLWLNREMISFGVTADADVLETRTAKEIGIEFC